MTALTKSSLFSRQLGGEYYPNTDVFPVAASAKLYYGGMVALFGGYAAPATPAAGGSPEIVIAGRARGTGSNGEGPIREIETDVDNTTGAAGDKHVVIQRGIFLLKNSSGVEALTQADVGKPCYAVDDITVSKLSLLGKRPRMGIVFGVPSATEAGGAAGVYVQVGAPTFERQTTTLLAGADLSSAQYHIVKLSAGAVVLAAADTDALFGVLQNAPDSGAVAEIVTWGPSLIQGSSAGFSTSVDLSSDGSGEAKDAASGDRLIGKAYEAASAGQIKMCYVMPGALI